MTQTNPKTVDYLCVLDFEATCSQGERPYPQEIIEFPTLLFNTKTRQVESVFHFYIKPDVHPKLSKFCTELTGITQETVDKGISLQEALRRHDQWLAECGVIPWHNALNDSKSEAKTFLYLTCGDWDLKTGLPQQLKYHDQKVPSCFCAWINIKDAFFKKYNKKAGGMKSLLRFFKLELEGKHHSGIDDCKNIARCCEAMLLDGWKPAGATGGITKQVPVALGRVGRIIPGLTPVNAGGKTKSQIKREKIKKKKQQEAAEPEQQQLPPSTSDEQGASAALEPEKRARKVKKLLKQIGDLKKSNVPLNDDQKAKVALEANLLVELEQLEL